MASSHGHPPPVTRPAAARPTRAALPSISSSSNGTAVGGGGGGVRRNLFQSQLTRRPTPTSSSSNSTETLRLDIDVLPETSDIVVRDKNGEFEVGDPPTPPVEEPDEGVLDEILENERERHKLAEVVKHHQINHNRGPAHAEEVMDALRASMRAQVAALSEDNWMYEPEEQPRGP